MAFDFDHDAFLDDDFCGKDAILTRAGIPATPIRVAFSYGVDSLELGGDVNLHGAVAQAGAKSADVAGVKRKDTLEVDGVVYRVIKVAPDETGWTTLYLGKDPIP